MPVVMNYTHPHAYPNNRVTDGDWPPVFGVNKFYDATPESLNEVAPVSNQDQVAPV